ncbi:MAG: sugar transferase [Flavobacteriales bacterium]|jgi:lipopolysaccharide/colanic/teichoic acid biosynthesis glycosyltransferase
MKRAFDIVISLLVLACFLPFGILLVLLIVVESDGGAFYFQERVGQNGRLFSLIKFRSMRINADKGSQITIGNRDPRITRTGYFIRRFKLDEFPQFVNVLIGDMSIVGPRPEVPFYVAMYTDAQRQILSVKPGITDYASIAYFHENELLAKAADPQKTYIEEVMPAKLALNQRYISNPSRFKDLEIMWLTAKKILGF